jgi:hypothetical protein
MAIHDDDREVEEFLEEWRVTVLPGIEQSAVVIAFCHGKVDPKMCLEVGAAVLLGKPLIVIAVDGSEIPPLLRRIATRIVKIDGNLMSEVSKERLTKAVNEVFAEIKRQHQ